MRVRSWKTILAVVSILSIMTALITALAQGFSPGAACVKNARRLSLALRMYVQDYDEMFPPMENSATMTALLGTYGRFSLLCPTTRVGYTFNPLLSGTSRASLGGDPSQIELFRDGQPHASQQSTVAYLDGSVLFGSVDIRPNEEKCIENLRRLSIGTMMYVQDYDEMFPPVPNYNAYREATLPYVGRQRSYFCPDTQLPYFVNTTLSGQNIWELPFWNSILLLQDAAPHRDGLFTYILLNGHVVRK